MTQAADILRRLGEGISDIVYHRTNVWRLLSILQSNEFRMSTSVGSGYEHSKNPKGKYYFFSTARSPNSHYDSGAYDQLVTLVLDGRALGQRYKGSPIDYWELGGKKLPQTDVEGPNAKSRFEMEDRIWSEKPTISPATKYIKEIHAFAANTSNADAWLAKLRQCWLLAKKNGIPMYVYKTDYDYENLTKRNTLKPSEVQLVPTMKPQDRYSIRRDPFDIYLELYHKKRYEDLSDQAQKKLYYLQYGLDGVYGRDNVTSLEANIHNHKTDPEVEKLVSIMRKERLHSARDFISLLQQKWKRIRGDE